MLDNQPKCLECKGGCCIDDVKLYGFMRQDLINLAGLNLVKSFEPGTFRNLDIMYTSLKKSDAPNGYYTLQNDKVGNDIDGLRIGPCGACVDGLCALQENKPHPCKMMDYEGAACLKIFAKRLAQISSQT